MMSEGDDKGSDNPFNNNSTSFAFSSGVESGSFFYVGAASKVISPSIVANL